MADIGKFAIGGAIVVVGIIASRGCSHSDDGAPRADPSVTAAIKQSREASAADACRSTLQAKHAEYDRLVGLKKYWDAARALEDCPAVLKDAELLKLVAAAEQAEHRSVALDAKRPLDERVRAIEALTRTYPEVGKELGPLLAQLRPKLDARIAADAQRAIAEDKARRKREGVSVGMSQQDVIASSWGKPQKVNRTTTAGGTREQWVYGGGYLYFENGVLTAIQN